MKRLFAILLCAILCLQVAPVAALAQQADQTQVVSVRKETVLAALYEADISTIRNALDSGLITSTELTQYYLDRIHDYNEPYNCFITICDDALTVAAERDKELLAGTATGILFGIPIVIKDNMDLAGYHTTNGFKKSDDQIAKDNADVVDYLLDQGAVIIAKANMSTQAQDALRSYSQAAGETKNAYSQYLAAGGSSGGSAVSTSLNFTVASLGTDTNSSLRIPAALAGCVSLRPTFGSISVDGIKKLNGTRDVPGAITRTVYDQAIMLDVLTQGSNRYVENLNKDALSGMRIGVLKQLSYATTQTGLRSEKNIDDEVAAAFENAIAELKSCGAEVVTVSMPKLFGLSDRTFSTNDSAPKAALYAAFQELLTQENISAVIYPTYLSTPIRSGRDANGTYWNARSQTNINNCRTLSPSAGIPEITVPIGVHSLGAGIGMEIASLKNSEQLLLDIAYSYTSSYNHRQTPEGAPNAHIQAYLTDLPELTSMQEFANDIAASTTGIHLQLPLDLNGIEPGNTQSSEALEQNILTYWPFSLLAVLISGFISLLMKLIRNKKKAHEKV